LSELGICSAVLALPFYEFGEEQKSKIKSAIKELQL